MTGDRARSTSARSRKDSIRQQVMTLPDGTYGVPDPDDPAVITLWQVRKGNMSAWPPGQRWAPFPPTPPEGLHGSERAAWREYWYDAVYWPWKAAVVDAITADPDTAAARFAEQVPEGQRPAPPPAPKPRPKPVGQRRQELEAAALYHWGRTVDEVAHALDLPKTTAWRRIQAGQEAFEPLEIARAAVGMDAIMRLAARRLAQHG